MSPMHVIKRLTDNTDHLLTTNESAKWPLLKIKKLMGVK